jgi:hypothetical protein
MITAGNTKGIVELYQVNRRARKWGKQQALGDVQRSGRKRRKQGRCAYLRAKDDEITDFMRTA